MLGLRSLNSSLGMRGLSMFSLKGSSLFKKSLNFCSLSPLFKRGNTNLPLAVFTASAKCSTICWAVIFPHFPFSSPFNLFNLATKSVFRKISFRLFIEKNLESKIIRSSIFFHPCINFFCKALKDIIYTSLAFYECYFIYFFVMVSNSRSLFVVFMNTGTYYLFVAIIGPAARFTPFHQTFHQLFFGYIQCKHYVY